MLATSCPSVTVMPWRSSSRRPIGSSRSTASRRPPFGPDPQTTDLVGPPSGELADSGSGDEVVPTRRVPHFVDRRVPDRQVLATLEVEQHDVALDRDVDVPAGVV